MSWWNAYSGIIAPSYLHYIEREQTATAISHYQSLVVPGLFQTPEYARRVLAASVPSMADVLLELRLRRQEILLRPDCPKMNVVLDDTVLRRGEPEILQPQLDRLRQIAATAPVAFRILPPLLLSVGAPFAIVEPSDYVYAETADGDGTEGDLARCRWIFGERWELATPLGS